MVRQLKIVLLGLVAALLVTPTFAREERWILLGEQTVGFSADRDTIRVDRVSGGFTRLKIEARTNDIFLNSLRVVFGNGSDQSVQVNALISAGGRPVNVDLKGERRAIRSITMLYKARPGFSGRSVVSVYGHQDAAEDEITAGGYGAGPDYPPPPPRVLDQQTFDRRADRIDFRVSGTSQRLAQLILRSVDDSLSLESLEVRYSNGPSQTINIYDRLTPGEQTQPIDIDGERRTVIGVTVIKRPSWRPGASRVELIGLERMPERQPEPRRSSVGVEPGRVPAGWVLFGAKSVGFSTDRDVIDVGPEIGQFGRIALSIREAEVYLREITLVYANGQRETREIYKSIPANSRTLPIEINGSRFLRQIELVYQSRLDRKSSRAVVEVYGEYDRRWLEDRNGYQNYNRGWLLLGAQRALMFSTDEDAFMIGPQFGTFRSLRLVVKRHAVRVTGIRVTYINGQVEELPIFQELVDGQSTQNLDLGRISKPIQRVDVRYRTKLNFQGEGIVELWGTR
ncbi:MAG: hypothetical protein ABL894_13780 [Hyphomicrobium sp.]